MSFKKKSCVYMSYKKKLWVYMSFNIKRHIYTSVTSWWGGNYCACSNPTNCQWIPRRNYWRHPETRVWSRFYKPDHCTCYIIVPLQASTVQHVLRFNISVHSLEYFQESCPVCIHWFALICMLHPLARGSGWRDWRDTFKFHIVEKFVVMFRMAIGILRIVYM